MVVKKTRRQYIRNEKEYASAEEVYNKKGTRYIAVDVGGNYTFTFSRTGKTLLEIDDVHLGEWITYKGKETKIWLSSPSAKRMYEKSVLPTLKMFLKQYPK